ncbi:MAG: polysaccharide biosynthesis tyrosine autokinase [Chitinophagaceae bacterium]|nr:polysaccharide biosynthesis tyrosine autokinase [Chitinophagaceae bacterium]MCW5905644.1 polysaccharide biosynthesis tyrosine autokinase [Chitinophagaceae bacterium]
MNATTPQSIIPGIVQQNEHKPKFSVREVLVKYLSHFPLFILSMVLCLGTALMYIRYKVPIYKANVQLLVRNSEKSGSQNDLISQAVSGVRSIILDNEMQLIRTKKLLENVVIMGGFNIIYSKEGNIKTSDSYKATPFTFSPIYIPDSALVYTFKVKSYNNTGGEIELSKRSKQFKWGDSLNLYGYSFRLIKNEKTIETSTDPYIINWLPVQYATGMMQSNLSVGTLSQKTSVLILGLTGENRKKTVDFLDLLVKEIIRSNIELKKENAINTVSFINNRLSIVAKELSDLEAEIRDYKKSNRFFDIQGEYLYLQSRLTDAEKVVLNLQLEIENLDKIDDYLRNNKSIGKSKVIPSNLGVDDMSYNTLIQRYNDLQIQKEKLEFVAYKDNPSSLEIDNQIEQLKQSILEAGAILKQSKKLKISTYEGRSDVDMEKLASLPDKELELININRQKGVKEKLYLYLLQKGEETAIASVSTESNYQELDPAYASYVPIEPKSNQIKTFAIILGLLIPIGIIYLLDLLNDKITTRQDIAYKTDIPIAGEISHVDNVGSIVVENSRNIVAEQFRILRSNLEFVLAEKNENKATSILITSSISGEGKSFISLNFAAVLALTGKRVALLEFDLRKLKGIEIDEIESNNDRGITNYLIGQTNDISSIYKTLRKHPQLHLYNTGPIPPNPAELIIGNRMEAFFTTLKENYDYIVIDSAPVGLVSDSFALSKFADATLYVIRQRYTLKKQMDFINDMKKDNKLHNMAIVVNDVNLAGRYGYYGYGYGYGYGYMYGYGKGYNRYIYGGRKKDPYFDANSKGYFDNNVKLSWWQRLFRK